MLVDKFKGKEGIIITYGITPPKEKNTPEKVREISQRQIDRVNQLGVDALVLYDLQDESDRTNEERPFPFFPTFDPLHYAQEYLEKLGVPKIIYRCVGKYSPEELINGISSCSSEDCAFVFVGAASSSQKVSLKIGEAYNVVRDMHAEFLLGGVTIPERHSKKGNEHTRIIEKASAGCEFFISQAVYNLEASKNFLSDYYYFCKENGVAPKRILFTLSPCGSLKTLEFMKWLGVSFPKWLENDLQHSEEVLEKSLEICKGIALELYQYCKQKGIPAGFNIESVSIRKTEIEASLALTEYVKSLEE